MEIDSDEFKNTIKEKIEVALSVNAALKEFSKDQLANNNKKDSNKKKEEYNSLYNTLIYLGANCDQILSRESPDFEFELDSTLIGVEIVKYNHKVEKENQIFWDSICDLVKNIIKDKLPPLKIDIEICDNNKNKRQKTKKNKAGCIENEIALIISNEIIELYKIWFQSESLYTHIDGENFNYIKHIYFKSDLQTSICHDSNFDYVDPINDEKLFQIVQTKETKINSYKKSSNFKELWLIINIESSERVDFECNYDFKFKTEFSKIFIHCLGDVKQLK